LETEAILAEQIRYYRARTLEYDEWWERRGRYDRGSEENARWFSERTEVLTAFDRLDLRGDVLELAPGTGIWTERLTRTARSVTAVDASEEMIAINRERMGEAAATVSYVQADLFAWEPTRRFDAAVFCFWDQPRPKGTAGRLPADRVRRPRDRWAGLLRRWEAPTELDRNRPRSARSRQ
jgi:SAM-dependent methyltransferase